MKYYYVKFNYLKTERAELITAAKPKGVIFQLQKMFDKSIDIIKLVEINKEKYDRLTLWRKLRYERKSSSSRPSGRLARIMSPLMAIHAYTSALDGKYSDVYNNLPAIIASPKRSRGKGRG